MSSPKSLKNLTLKNSTIYMHEAISAVKVIRDPVHGYITVPKVFFSAIIDTYEYQRLRGVKQLGTAFLTYPGATHTRFEHSLGVFHLGSLVLKTLLEKKLLDVPSRKIESLERTIQAALLLHDIGHPPFSHVCERFIDNSTDQLAILEEKYHVTFDKNPRSNHELAGCQIVLEKFQNALDSLDVDVQFLLRMITGTELTIASSDLFSLNLTKNHQQVLSEILNSPIDVDRLDYILRDMYFSGANVANLDVERFIRSYQIESNHLTISRHGLDYIPNFIYGREALFNSLYFHHNVIYTESLLARVIYGALKKEILSKDFFSPLLIAEKGRDDSSLFHFLREIAMTDPLLCHYAKQLLTRRKVLKPVWKTGIDYNTLIRSKPDLATLLKTARGAFEAGLIRELGLNEHELIISVAKSPVGPSGSKSIHISVAGGLTTFHEIFNDSIRRIKSPGIFIYCPKDKTQSIIDFINSADESSLLNIIELGKKNPTFFSDGF